ncbi:hypothetical protein FB567DRAFT_205894 [Paraphoma chrysanthemicola]|uniref:NACHT domain-containing protein n=1 Tax=Paraphoma chrysanthemicola TaxID=798071 RepID=A0A8K0QUX0_9PLEO|nr:hypothetical protein FB567DRAFT_205894 [Paraphoma chrysanthemicola]
MAAFKDQNLWDEALQTLPEDDQTKYEGLISKGSGYITILDDILLCTKEKKEQCTKKRWKVRIRGRTIILSDVLEKFAVWVNKFVAVGDVAVQYDPGHAALPWAAIRFILKTSLNEVEVFGAVLQGVESVSRTLTRCTVMENLYLLSDFKISDQLREALVGLYAAILTFLGKSLQHYSRSTVTRIAKTIVTTVDEVEKWSDPIEEKQAEVERLVALAEAERNRVIAGGLSDVQTRQNEQGMKLEKSYQALQQLSADLLGPITRIDQRLSFIEDDLERGKRNAILESISRIKFIVHHRLANSGLVQGSGQWFLNKPNYQQWRDDSCSSILWLHGIPGSGKTKLTSLVVAETKKTCHVAYFYAVRNPAEPERSECDQIVRSLLRQLACPSPGGPVLAPLLDKYEDALAGLEDFTDIMWSLDDAVETLMELCNLYPAVVLIIDALDEVDPIHRLELVDGLLRIMENSSALVKIFISSRENMDIFERLESKPNLRIGAQDNAEDIAKFVHRQLKVANLLQGKLPPALKERIPETLIAGAQGMFRWVDLQIQSLRSLKVAADIDERLGRLPSTLEESYVEIFEQIIASGEHASRLAIFTFQWLLFAQKPIAISDFAPLASIELSQTLGHTAQNVLEVCQNLVVSNDEGIFRFVHLSVREFFENLKEGRLKHREIKHFTSDEGHAAIAMKSLAYLKAIMSLGINQKADHLLKTSQLDKIIALKSYTVNYWPYHVSESGQLKRAAPLLTEVRSFLVKNKGVASTFANWCSMVWEEKSENSLPAVRKAAQKPPNPIFLVHTYDLLDRQHASVSDRDYQTQAFLYAAGEGNTKDMTELLAHGLDIKDVGVSAMFRAISANKLDPVEFLKEYRVPVDPKSLLATAMERRTNMVRTLITYDAKAISMAQLELVFRITMANGDVDLLPLFLEQGIARDPVAVVRALKATASISARNLIEAGFDIQGIHLFEKRTALHWAIDKGLQDIVRLLLEKNARVNVADAWGNHPLHIAAWKGRADAVRLLLDRGAHERYMNHAGQTPLHLAAMMGFPDIVHLLQHGEVEMTKKDKSGKTPLCYANEHEQRRNKKALGSIPQAQDNNVVEKTESDRSCGDKPANAIATEQQHDATVEI